MADFDPNAPFEVAGASKNQAPAIETPLSNGTTDRPATAKAAGDFDPSAPFEVASKVSTSPAKSAASGEGYDSDTLGSAAKAAWHGVTGKPESAEERGKTTTASPMAEDYGTHASHLGYSAGSAARDVGGFLKSAYEDVVEKPTPVLEGQDSMAQKYVVGPAEHEKQRAQEEAAAFHKTHGLESAGHGASSLLHTAGELIPGVGPIVGGLVDRAAGGDIGGAAAQAATYEAAPKVAEEATKMGAKALPKAYEQFRQGGTEAPKGRVGKVVQGVRNALPEGPANAKHSVILEDRLKKAQADAVKPQADYDAHEAIIAEGGDAPAEVLKKHENAQLKVQEAKAALDAHNRMLAGEKTAPAPAEREITPAEVAAARPDQPTPTKEENDAKLSGLMDQIAPEKPQAENVKGPGQVQPETFPQEPTEAPQAFTGMRQLPGGEPVGRQLALPAYHEAEGVPEQPKAAEPIPEAPKPATAAEMAGLKSVGGKVTEAPEKAVAPLVKQGLAPYTVSDKNTMEAPKTQQEHWQEEDDAEFERKVATLRAGKAAEAPKETPKTAPERSPEDMSKVEAVVKDHSDQELARLGKKYGVDESEYDFSKRDAKRHRIERDDFVNELLSKMPEKDIDNIARLAGEFDNKDTTTWTSAERNNQSRAQRARAIMQEHEGGPKTVAGGAPEEKVGTEEGAKQDTDHFAQAKKELPNGTLSEQLGRAQELKHDAAIVEEHNAGTGSSLLKDGKKVEDGYVVGINKELEHTIDGEKITPEDIKAYRERPDVQKALKENPKAFIGTWVDGGKTYFDTSIPEPDLETAKKMGKDNEQKAIFDAKSKETIYLESRNYPEGYPESAKEGGEGPLPEVGGGAPGKAGKSKPLPTGDDLIKKYGESDGDPAHTAFILPDGRGVAQTGTIHDEMLGGKTTDADPPRERFIEQGNIRVRAHGVYGNREIALSIPDRMTPDQLAYIQKMSPMLRSGAVMIEGARLGSEYRVIEYGKATDEALEKNIREISQVVPKGYPKGTPEVGGGAPGTATKMAKESAALPELAEKHLTPEEKAGVSKSKQAQDKFVQRMTEMPEIHEWVDAAERGAGERKWYQRSTQAIDAMTKEAPEYFGEEGDRDKFTGLLASGSPQQSVVNNMREALRVWTSYVDAGRPEGDALEKLLSKPMVEGGFTLPAAKVPNAMKALAGEPMYPDITKNSNFKVPSFRDNLAGMLQRVTNDGWMALFSGMEAKDISGASSYHPISVMVRAAADELGWEPAEAQAAIWAFIKTLVDQGKERSETPSQMREYSEDFADIIKHDPQTRGLLKEMGVNHAELDKRLEGVEPKPEPKDSSGESATAEDSARRASERVTRLRGQGAIPAPKTGDLFRELRIAEEERGRRISESPEAVTFDTNKFKTQTGGDSKLRPLGKKKSPLGRATR